MADKVYLIALKAHRYNGQLWMPGERFAARPDDVKLLKQLGRAKEAEGPPAGRYKRRDLKAEK